MSFLTSLPQRALISVRGRDTFKYLQALTTNRIVPPCSQFSSFLNAQGRVLYDVFIYQTSDTDCFIEVDANHVEGLLSHLKRYKLRSKIEMRALDESEMMVHSLYNTEPSHRPEMLRNFVHQDDRRAPDFGIRILAKDASQLDFLEANERAVSTYTLHRYLNGIPEGADEIISEKALPMESNIDYMNGLEFHKGCYLGQELTVRTYHTGVIRKRIVPVRLFQPEEEPPASLDAGINFDDISDKWCSQAGEKSDSAKASGNESRGRPAVRLLASIGQIGLGLCRLDKLTRGTIMQDGRELGVVPFRPSHWPAAT